MEDTIGASTRGYRWRQVAAQFRKHCQATDAKCWLCGQAIDYSAAPQTPDAFEADHRLPVETHPQLAYMITNLRPSHSSCNRSRGSRPVVAGDWARADF